MRKVTMQVPSLKETIGPTFENYPTGFMWPYTVLIREVHVKYPTNEKIVATFPGYGILTKEGRKYSLSFDEKYAKVKGYPETIEGTWG